MSLKTAPSESNRLVCSFEVNIIDSTGADPFHHEVLSSLWGTEFSLSLRYTHRQW